MQKIIWAPRNLAKLRSCIFVLFSIFLSLGWGLITSPASAEFTERVSVATGGAEGNSFSVWPAISADGRFVGFYSFATNLVLGDTNDASDVFVFDRKTHQTERVSVASDGTEANGASDTTIASSWLSADGRFVVFTSMASNLVPNDTNGFRDVFVRDRQTGQTERISVSATGDQGNGDSSRPVISADGRFVAFVSLAGNLVPGDGNGLRDVFVRDRNTGTIERVIASADASLITTISADGRYVVFNSSAPGLVAGDTNFTYDIFVYDRLTQQTERASISSDGAQANNASGSFAISSDGRYVVFDSHATNLIPSGDNHLVGAYLHDRLTGQTEKIAVMGTTSREDVSADGRFVAFGSNASDLVDGDTNNRNDVFVRDHLTGQTTRVSVTSSGAQATGGDSVHPAITPDGQFVAFMSDASNLVPGDTNGVEDIFVRYLGSQTSYSFIGFDQPLENLPFTNSAKAGSAIPIKWQVTDEEGNYVSDPGVIQSLQFAPVACDAQDLDYENPITALATGDSGLRYESGANRFSFTWSTDKSMMNTCDVFILTLTDGQQWFARFMLR